MKAAPQVLIDGEIPRRESVLVKKSFDFNRTQLPSGSEGFPVKAQVLAVAVGRRARCQHGVSTARGGRRRRGMHEPAPNCAGARDANGYVPHRKLDNRF